MRLLKELGGRGHFRAWSVTSSGGLWSWGPSGNKGSRAPFPRVRGRTKKGSAVPSLGKKNKTCNILLLEGTKELLNNPTQGLVPFKNVLLVTSRDRDLTACSVAKSRDDPQFMQLICINKPSAPHSGHRGSYFTHSFNHTSYVVS